MRRAVRMFTRNPRGTHGEYTVGKHRHDNSQGIHDRNNSNRTVTRMSHSGCLSPFRSIPSVWGKGNDAPLHSPRRDGATPPTHGARITRQPAPVTAPAELGPGAQCSLLALPAALRLSGDSKQSKHIVVRYTCFAWSSAAGLERGRLG